MTKIKISIEIELPDNHLFGGSTDSERQEVRQNLYDLLNKGHTQSIVDLLNLLENKQQMTEDKFEHQKEWLQSVKEVWEKITDKVKISVDAV
jgi:hypothetical protein